MEHFQATLDPRKQELLEARFLGARVSCLYRRARVLSFFSLSLLFFYPPPPDKNIFPFVVVDVVCRLKREKSRYHKIARRKLAPYTHLHIGDYLIINARCVYIYIYIYRVAPNVPARL